MALVKCPECGNEISKKAESCPHCGHILKRKSGCGAYLILFILLGILVIIIPLCSKYIDDEEDYSVDSNYASKYYAHKTINVRDKPTTDSEILYLVKRGDIVRIKPTASEWAEVYSNDSLSGYIYKPLLEKNPIPPLEIVSWNWYSDRDYAEDGRVIWSVEVRNNTSSYIEHVKVEFTTYDSSENIITSEYTYVRGLPPGGSGSARSTATYFGTEEVGKVRIVN